MSHITRSCSATENVPARIETWQQSKRQVVQRGVQDEKKRTPRLTGDGDDEEEGGKKRRKKEERGRERGGGGRDQTRRNKVGGTGEQSSVTC